MYEGRKWNLCMALCSFAAFEVFEAFEAIEVFEVFEVYDPIEASGSTRALGEEDPAFDRHLLQMLHPF